MNGMDVFPPQVPGLTLRVAPYTATGTWTCPPNVYCVQVLLVGGGGAGGGQTGFYMGGGGGGGGVLRRLVPVAPGVSYAITIGAGGTLTSSSTYNSSNGLTYYYQTATNGSASTFTAVGSATPLLTALGGGSGATVSWVNNGSSYASGPGRDGASGGGGGSYSPSLGSYVQILAASGGGGGAGGPAYYAQFHMQPGTGYYSITGSVSTYDVYPRFVTHYLPGQSLTGGSGLPGVGVIYYSAGSALIWAPTAQLASSGGPPLHGYGAGGAGSVYSNATDAGMNVGAASAGAGSYGIDAGPNTGGGGGTGADGGSGYCEIIWWG